MRTGHVCMDIGYVAALMVDKEGHPRKAFQIRFSEIKFINHTNKVDSTTLKIYYSYIVIL